MTASLTSSTVVIENYNGSDGLQIVNNAAYIENQLAVMISADPDDIKKRAGTWASCHRSRSSNRIRSPSGAPYLAKPKNSCGAGRNVSGSARGAWW